MALGSCIQYDSYVASACNISFIKDGITLYNISLVGASVLPLASGGVRIQSANSAIFVNTTLLTEAQAQGLISACNTGANTWVNVAAVAGTPNVFTIDCQTQPLARLLLTAPTDEINVTNCDGIVAQFKIQGNAAFVADTDLVWMAAFEWDQGILPDLTLITATTDALLITLIGDSNKIHATWTGVYTFDGTL